MAFKSRYLDAITTLFVFVTVAEIKCQGLQYDRPSPEIRQQDALPTCAFAFATHVNFGMSNTGI